MPLGSVPRWTAVQSYVPERRRGFGGANHAARDGCTTRLDDPLRPTQTDQPAHRERRPPRVPAPVGEPLRP
jgi:hypothetical protein